MKPEEHAEPHERHPRQHVRIVHLTAPVFRALANGDLAAANTVSPVPLPAYFAGPEWRALWHRRSKQVEEDPASALWVTGVIWDERRQVAVGRAGYHGPPDPSGMVEIGYAVDPAYRRRGYARAALEALLQRAAREPQVRTVRVTISPDNAASYQLASQYGFTATGEQWDDEDGLEIIYEVSAGTGPAATALPVAAVNQFSEGFPLAGPRGLDRVVAWIGMADGDSPDGHPLGRHPVLCAEAGQGAQVEAEERGAEAFIGHGEQDEQRGEPGVVPPPASTASARIFHNGAH